MQHKESINIIKTRIFFLSSKYWDKKSIMKYQDINKLIKCRDFCGNDLKIVMLNKQKKNKENNINCIKLWYTLCIYDSDQRRLSFYQYLKIFSFPPIILYYELQLFIATVIARTTSNFLPQCFAKGLQFFSVVTYEYFVAVSHCCHCR